MRATICSTALFDSSSDWSPAADTRSRTTDRTPTQHESNRAGGGVSEDRHVDDRKPVGPHQHSRPVDPADPWNSRAVSDLANLTNRMRDFSDARDWGQFHDPKSLILALMGEVGELSELFQWLPAEGALDSAAAEPLHTRVGEELADILLYLVRLADVLGIDLAHAANSKLTDSESRFVTEDFRGVAPVKD